MTSNTRLLCVDDEEMILELFRMILDGREMRSGAPSGARFELATFSNGDDAARAVATAVAQGRPYCGGFFDLKLGDGPSGAATIRKVREADPRLLCCLISADPTEVPAVEPIFQGRAEDWMYLAKPVGVEEVRRRALQMVSEWERRRRDERAREDLRAELESAQSQLRYAEQLASIARVAADACREINAQIGALETNLAAFRAYTFRIAQVLDASRDLAAHTQAVPETAAYARTFAGVLERSQADRIRDDLIPLLDESSTAIARLHQAGESLMGLASTAGTTASATTQAAPASPSDACGDGPTRNARIGAA